MSKLLSQVTELLHGFKFLAPQLLQLLQLLGGLRVGLPNFSAFASPVCRRNIHLDMCVPSSKGGWPCETRVDGVLTSSFPLRNAAKLPVYNTVPKTSGGNRQHPRPAHRPPLNIFKSTFLLPSPPPLHIGYRASWPCCSGIGRNFISCNCTSHVFCPRSSIFVSF